MGGWFDKITMSGFCDWRRPGAGPEQGNRPLTRATQPKQPSFRRKPESRKSYRKRACRLQNILDSGFRRNDGL